MKFCGCRRCIAPRILNLLTSRGERWFSHSSHSISGGWSHGMIQVGSSECPSAGVIASENRQASYSCLVMWGEKINKCWLHYFCIRISNCTLSFAFHTQRMWGFWVGLTKPMIFLTYLRDLFLKTYRIFDLRIYILEVNVELQYDKVIATMSRTSVWYRWNYNCY